MKKVLFTLLAAGMFSFYACGPSAEEKAAAEKATQDSMAAADAAAQAAAQSSAMMDSIAMSTDTTAKK